MQINFNKDHEVIKYYQVLREKAFLNAPYWLSATVTGFVAYSYAQLFHFIGLFPEWLATEYSWSIFIVTPLAFLASWFVIFKFAEGAAGSGIPQAMAAHELDCHKYCNAYEYLVGIKTAFIKIISSFLILLGGGAIGREGPTIQISASIFYFITNKLERKWSKINMEYCILAGSAAGLASAFNTPLGGIVYAVEELATVHLHKFRTILISAVIISGLIALWFSGPYLYLGYPSVHSFKFSQLPYVFITAIASGFLGAIFGKLLYRLLKLKGLKAKTPLVMAKVTFVLGLLMAALIYFGNRYAMGPGNDLILDLLFKSTTYADLLTVFERFTGTLISSLSGAAGGIFAPSLAVGASVGSYISSYFAPELENLLVLLGMIGFLTGVTRAPFTSFILVLEMTNKHAIIFPMMLTSLVASLCAGLIDDKSFYENMKIEYVNKFQDCCPADKNVCDNHNP